MPKDIPSDRLFSTEHEWVKIDGALATVGITDHAQCALGDVVYVELPRIGSIITKGKAIGVVESVKAVSDLFAPVSGVVVSVNMSIIEHPERINHDPYGEGWMLTIELSNSLDHQALLDKTNYQALLLAEAK